MKRSVKFGNVSCSSGISALIENKICSKFAANSIKYHDKKHLKERSNYLRYQSQRVR